VKLDHLSFFSIPIDGERTDNEVGRVRGYITKRMRTLTLILDSWAIAMENVDRTWIVS